MKKKILGICIVVLMLVALVSGCTENNDNGGTTEAKTYTWTAKQLLDDMATDEDWSDGIEILYTTLNDGDTVIITDTISEVTYDSVTDRTTITFTWNWSEVSTFF